jgi:hypothetical protein
MLERRDECLREYEFFGMFLRLNLEEFNRLAYLLVGSACRCAVCGQIVVRLYSQGNSHLNQISIHQCVVSCFFRPQLPCMTQYPIDLQNSGSDEFRHWSPVDTS